MDGECTAVVSVKDKKRRETVGGLERKRGKGEGEHASWRVRAGQVSACEARASRALEGARQAPAGPWRAGEEVERVRLGSLPHFPVHARSALSPPTCTLASSLATSLFCLLLVSCRLSLLALVSLPALMFTPPLRHAALPSSRPSAHRLSPASRYSRHIPRHTAHLSRASPRVSASASPRFALSRHSKPIR